MQTTPRPSDRALFAAISPSHRTPPVTALEPDAELTRLGHLFDRAAAAERAAWAIVDADDTIDDPDPEFVLADRLADETHAIVEMIQPHRATTLAGLLVKIRAITYYSPSDPITDLVDQHAGWGIRFPKSIDRPTQLLMDLLTDMQAMAGAGRRAMTAAEPDAELLAHARGYLALGVQIQALNGTKDPGEAMDDAMTASSLHLEAVIKTPAMTPAGCLAKARALAMAIDHGGALMPRS